MPSFQLSTGCCEHLPLSSSSDDSQWSEAIVQFLQVKKVRRGPTERYRLLISDGVHFISGMLAEQCNALVESGDIQVHTVAAIEHWSSNVVQNRRLLIPLSVRALGNPGERIGSPTSLYDFEETPGIEDSATATSGCQPIITTKATSQLQQCRPPNDNQQRVMDKAAARATMPIGDLNPYQNSWTIRTRVTQKSDFKSWNKENSDGKLFSVVFADESGEIKATAFNTVADELFSKLEEGKVYYISKAKIKCANKKYTKDTYELTFERDTIIEECRGVDDLPLPKNCFVTLDKLECLEKGSLCDVIGIVQDVGVITSILTRQGEMIKKRSIQLVDDTRSSVQVTLWAAQAESFHAVQNAILALKSVRVGYFGGVSLSAINSTRVEVEPANDDCIRIRRWYESHGGEVAFRGNTAGASGSTMVSQADAPSLSEIKSANAHPKNDMEDGFDTFSSQATIVHIRGESLYYPACTGLKCLKKMTQQGDFWHCDKCGTNAVAPDYRYIMSMAVMDWSDVLWLQGFNEIGEAIFEKTANELYSIRMEDETKYNEIIHQASCRTFNFKCRTRKDQSEDRARVRYVIAGLEPINYHQETGYMLELLRSPQWGRPATA